MTISAIVGADERALVGDDLHVGYVARATVRHERDSPVVQMRDGVSAV